MEDPDLFPNAPIAEALFDIRVKLPPDADLDQLAAFQDSIRDRFPRRLDMTAWGVDVQIAQGGPPEVLQPTSGAIGYAFQSPDQKKLVQARLDGFTFNKLRPYEEWRVFRDEARELWQHYIAIARPISTTRLALRYINRIEIPLPFNDFKEYILTVPEIAPGLPQGLAELFMRLVIPYPEERATAIVTETIERVEPDARVLPFIFDIDVFREAILDPQAKEIWDTFETLRRLKNDIFFKSLTKEAKRLFE
jgi:uncharacterized protein (TIGR04255 family)